MAARSAKQVIYIIPRSLYVWEPARERQHTLCKMNGIKQIYNGVRCVTTNSKKLHNSGAASLRRPKSRITRTMRGHSLPKRCSKQMHKIRNAAKYTENCNQFPTLTARASKWERREWKTYIEMRLDIVTPISVPVVWHPDCR